MGNRRTLMAVVAGYMAINIQSDLIVIEQETTAKIINYTYHRLPEIMPQIGYNGAKPRQARNERRKAERKKR